MNFLAPELTVATVDIYKVAIPISIVTLGWGIYLY